MDISLSFSKSGDEIELLLQDSSFEEDVEVMNGNDTEGFRMRHGGGSIPGKAPNKNRNRSLGHEILMQVSAFCHCCCCC